MLDPSFPAGMSSLSRSRSYRTCPFSRSILYANNETCIGPSSLSRSIRPLSNYLGLTTLPLHIHEILFAYTLYESIFRVLSPALSRRLWPQKYGTMTRRQRLNWDAHVVSMFQALFINTATLWVIFADPARSVRNEGWNWTERLWGYNGAAGMCQAFAAGYFLWDVVVSSVHIDVMGASSLVHAVAALGITGIGFVSIEHLSEHGV